MFNIINKRFWFYLLTGAASVVAIVALAVFGLKPGIEFSSGSILSIRFEQQVSQDDLKAELAKIGYENAIIQVTGSGDFFIRTNELTGTKKIELEASLKDRFGNLTESEFSSVSPIVASETASNAGIAVAISAIGILLYVSWAFRRMPKPFHYGACAVIALVHDALVAAGVFAILGAIAQWEINLMFITGILAVIGYSVNNAVVVFDRIRENLHKGISSSFEVVVNHSIVEILGRSLNTSLTTLFAIIALMLFVGASIQNFVIVLLIGVVVGTYSSVIVAPALLVTWEKREWGRFLKLPSSG